MEKLLLLARTEVRAENRDESSAHFKVALPLAQTVLAPTPSL
jgi:hypothetical protein